MSNVDVTRIASNIGALNALNSLTNINKQLATHQTRISTGKRINSASEDPAGLTIATKMLARSEGLKVALSNIGDASNMLAVAESGLGKMNDILVQMRSKAEQAATDTLGATERQAIQTQLSAYAEQIDTIVKETKWNGTSLLDGTVDKRFQTGADTNEFTTWQLSQNHDAATLAVATTTTQVTTSLNGAVVGDTFGAAAPTADGVYAGLTSLKTGLYKLNTLDTAASATQGKALLSSASTLVGGVGSFVTPGATAVGEPQLTSGNYKIKVANVVGVGAGNAADLEIYDNSNNLIGTAAVDGAVTGNIDLKDATKITGTGFMGVSVAIDGAAFVSGATMNFEYIAAGNVKYELQDGSGGKVTIDQDGVSGGATGSYGYFDASAGAATVHTGVGVKVTSSVFVNAAKNENLSFNYQELGNYVIDVSTAARASNYMGLVNTAIDTVNSSMTSLGSLMARLNFKEDQISTAQVNVEASYSRIMNANMAEEQMNASKYTILQQTAISMLAQANQAPQSLLTLFR